MDLIDLPGDSHLSFEEGTDTIHYRVQDVENHDDEDHDDENYPTRPISRLGFNRPSLASSSACHDTPKLDAIQWSRSLFQSIGISELRLSTLKTDTSSSAHSTPDIGESNIPILSGGEERFESPYGNAEDMIKYVKVDRKSPSTSPPSVSRLSFPFVTTQSPRGNKAPSPLRPFQHHKYSCFPSLMSPEPAAYRFPSHQRHSYRQHGYSRLALQHLKWFWSAREHEWKTSDPDRQNVKVTLPDALLDEPAVIHPFSGVPTSDTHSHRNSSPATIHPRRGDIAALRDPYSFYIDRCFAGFANWTMGKIIWMLDLHAAEKRKMEVDTEQEASDEESETELETSTSMGFSDDSDSTLVESENESDALFLRNTILDSITINNDEIAAESPQVLSVGYLDNTSRSESLCVHITKSKKSDCNKLPWATNWYRRWALLANISRGNQDRKHLLFKPVAPTIEFVPNLKDDTGPHFILDGKHKYLANDELWNSKLGNSDN